MEKWRLRAHIVGMTNFWTGKGRKLRYGWGVFFVLMMLYGLVRFPDAPFHECAGGYCGKRGLLHTAVEYHEFYVWQSTLLIGWVVCIGWALFLRFGSDK
jgi:hypothetical protein